MSLVTGSENTVVSAEYRANWIGLFTGENQKRAVERSLAQLQDGGLGCCGLILDRWNPFVRLWWALVALLTLGFLVRVPSIVLVAQPQPPASAAATVIGTRYRAGWVGLFSGENQARALRRTLADLNARSLGCLGLVQDRWNPFVRFGWILVAIVTLGFYVKVPNVLVVTQPI